MDNNILIESKDLIQESKKWELPYTKLQKKSLKFAKYIVSVLFYILKSV